MTRPERSPVYGSVVVLALAAVALGISLWLRQYLEPDIFLLFVVAVWLSAWYYGRTIGLFAVGASAFALLYFFVDGVTPAWAVGARLAAFLVTGSLITWVTAAWRESRRVLMSTLASIGDAVVVTDREGRITFLNTVAEALTGWSVEDARHLPGEAILRLIDEGTRQTIENPLTRALRD